MLILRKDEQMRSKKLTFMYLTLFYKGKEMINSWKINLLMQKDTNKGGDNLVGTFSLQIHFFNAKRHRERKRMQLLNAYKV